MTKVTEAGMTPRKFAEKVKKDYSNFFRELKGQTKLTLKQMRLRLINLVQRELKKKYGSI